MGKTGVWTVSTLWVADWAVPVPDRAGFRMLRRESVVCRAGVRFESHLGHVFSLFRGFLVFLRVDSVHTLASDLMFRVCGAPETVHSVAWGSG